MAYEICKACGRMFEKSGQGYCDLCYEKNKEEYNLVLNYINENPDNQVLEIIAETGVSMKTINRFIKDGSISYKNEEKE